MSINAHPFLVIFHSRFYQHDLKTTPERPQEGPIVVMGDRFGDVKTSSSVMKHLVKQVIIFDDKSCQQDVFVYQIVSLV